MKALGQALTFKEATQPQAVSVIRLLALTGGRLSEIAQLKWSWVDLHHGVLRLPTSKTGERLIVLGRLAIDLIASLPRHEGTDQVFPPLRKGERFLATPKVWRAVCELSGVKARLHDLRHHFASLAAELGYTLPTISALLGHSIPGTTGRYLHHTDAALKEAANRVAEVASTRLHHLNAGRTRDAGRKRKLPSQRNGHLPSSR
jgi:integrase